MHYEGDEWDDKFTLIHKSRPPLRWFANVAGSIASSALMRISWAQEEDKDSGLRYGIDCIIWDKLWPIYNAWGSYYKMQKDIE